MKRLKFNLCAVIIAIVYLSFLMYDNISISLLNVTTVSGSFMDQFAYNHHLPIVDHMDKGKNIVKYEEFEYNNISGGISLIRYLGEGNEIVIPEEIDGKKVLELEKDFFEKSPTIEKLYLPNTINQICDKPNEKITLFCEKTSPILEVYSTTNDLSESEIKPEEESEEIPDWNIKIIPNTTVNYNLGTLPFKYNVKENGIELVEYTGKDRDLIIPSYINGKEVKTISFDLVNHFDHVTFPETVTEMNGAVFSVNYTMGFAVECGFTLTAFILTLIILNTIIPKLTNTKEIYLFLPQLIISVLYILAQCLFGLLVIYSNTFTILSASIISSFLMIVYIILIISISATRKHVITVENTIAEKTSWMNTFKNSCSNLTDGIDDLNVKKQVSRLIENIHYSDSVSSPQSNDVNQKLKIAVDNLRSAISRGSTAEILEKCDIAQKVLQERNNIVKSEKQEKL